MLELGEKHAGGLVGFYNYVIGFTIFIRFFSLGDLLPYCSIYKFRLFRVAILSLRFYGAVQISSYQIRFSRVMGSNVPTDEEIHPAMCVLVREILSITEPVRAVVLPIRIVLSGICVLVISIYLWKAAH